MCKTNANAQMSSSASVMQPVNAFMQAVNPFIHAANAFMQAVNGKLSCIVTALTPTHQLGRSRSPKMLCIQLVFS